MNIYSIPQYLVEYIKWERVAGYLNDLGFSPDVGKDCFIPENIFYRLAMKAKSEAMEGEILMCELTMAQKIKKLREENQLTLEEVGNAVGVGKSTVRKWETGIIANMRRDKIASLANVLHTTPEYLMGWTEKTADPWSAKFRESLQELIISADETDAHDSGIDLSKWRDIAYGSAPLSLETCCNVCDEAGESLDEMTGLREKKTAESICGLDELSIKMAEIIHGLSPAAKEEAVHYLEYLESKSKM